MKASLVFRLLFSLGLLLLTCAPALAQRDSAEARTPRTVSVAGEAMVQLQDNMTMDQARADARDRAALDALEKAFGTSIVQGTATRTEWQNTNQPSTFFNLIADRYVKGEWIETTGEQFETITQARNDGSGNNLFIKCKIRGTAREITEPRPMLDLETLSCPSKNCATDKFLDGQAMYLYAKAPADGFIQIYLEDGDKVYNLLPYQNMPSDQRDGMPLAADQPYVLFSTLAQHNYFTNPAFQEDEIELTAEGPQTFHRLYVVFSPKPLPRPLMDPGKKIRNGYTSPRETSRDAFQQWLTRLKQFRTDLSIQTLDILVLQS